MRCSGFRRLYVSFLQRCDKLTQRLYNFPLLWLLGYLELVHHWADCNALYNLAPLLLLLSLVQVDYCNVRRFPNLKGIQIN